MTHWRVAGALFAIVAVASAQTDPNLGPHMLEMRATIPQSISVTAKTDLTFARPIPDGGMLPEYSGTVYSADVVENDPTHPGVAHIQVASNDWLAWSWLTGTNLYNGTAYLPTAFEFRHRGWWDILFLKYGKTLTYYPGGTSSSGYGYSGWVPAMRALYDVSGSAMVKGQPVTDGLADVWIRARVTRKAQVDPPGLYQQTSTKLQVTFSLF